MEQQWAEVNRAFAEAMEQAPEERARYLAESVPDEGVRKRVSELLKAWESSDGFSSRSRAR
jgi:hypothetical protein